MTEDEEKVDCRNCKYWDICPCGKSGHEKGTSLGYSIGECKNYIFKRKEEQHGCMISSR